MNNQGPDLTANSNTEEFLAWLQFYFQSKLHFLPKELTSQLINFISAVGVGWMNSTEFEDVFPHLEKLYQDLSPNLIKLASPQMKMLVYSVESMNTF
jgi:hypothetical protein